MTESQSTFGTWPSLSYLDAEAAIGYLVEVVGFTESAVYRSEGGARAVDHAELLWPTGGGIMFGSDAGAGGWTGASRVGHGSMYLYTPEVAAVAERVARAGWRVLRPLQSTDYGSTEFAFADPEGNAFSVGTYAGHHAG